MVTFWTLLKSIVSKTLSIIGQALFYMHNNGMCTKVTVCMWVFMHLCMCVWVYTCAYLWWACCVHMCILRCVCLCVYVCMCEHNKLELIIHHYIDSINNIRISIILYYIITIHIALFYIPYNGKVWRIWRFVRNSPN